MLSLKTLLGQPRMRGFTCYTGTFQIIISAFLYSRGSSLTCKEMESQCNGSREREEGRDSQRPLTPCPAIRSLAHRALDVRLAARWA